LSSEINICIEREADIVTARQKGRELCAELGFSMTDRTLVATAISEVARNIVRYAEKGEVVLSRGARDGRTGIVVIARDHGPGIAEPELAMRDGFSTGNSLGLGLPGAKRLMDEFELVSAPSAGTTVTMRKWLR
jgi:serine/threonine-protein kinase RsbT